MRATLDLSSENGVQENLRGDKTNILVLHHHIVPIPETGRERNDLIDAGEVVELLIRNGVALMLAGHRHVPYSIRLMRTHIIHAGTLGSFKVLGMPDQNCNIMDMDDEFITLKLKFVDLGEVEVGKYTIKTDVPESVDIYHRIAKPKKVLFVSKDDACRTRIAEAIFNKISPNNMLALSAGLKASEMSPMAIEVLREMRINTGNRKGRQMTQEQFREFDYVISFDPDIDANEH